MLKVITLSILCGFLVGMDNNLAEIKEQPKVKATQNYAKELESCKTEVSAEDKAKLNAEYKQLIDLIDKSYFSES